jgi:hypothetical protein
VTEQEATLWIVGTGAETATQAMNNLGLEPITLRSTDEDTYWQAQDDAPNLQTLMTRLDRRKQGTDMTSQERPKWIIITLTQRLFNKETRQAQLQEVLTKGRELDCKAVICMWTTNDRKEEERQAEKVKEWTNDIGWKTVSGQLRNEEHDGYLEGCSTYLITAKARVINRLPRQYDESNDGYHYLEQILDVNNGTIEDCFTYFTAQTEERKQKGKGTKIKTKVNIQHKGQQKEIAVFDVASIGPAIVSGRHAMGSYAFAIEATDGITSQ